jgi:hypothetical protein
MLCIKSFVKLLSTRGIHILILCPTSIAIGAHAIGAHAIGAHAIGAHAIGVSGIICEQLIDFIRVNVHPIPD